MSKKAFISRYFLILNKLRRSNYASLKELQKYIENQLESMMMQDDTLTMGLSERTLKRDIREIRNLFGISIEYSRPNNGYYIDNDIENLNLQRMLEAFNLFNSMNISTDLSPFIYHENRRSTGTENLYGLIHAIKNQRQIRFDYQKYRDDEKSYRIGEPYALKEFKNRWYLLMCDLKDKRVKTFALDCIFELEITKEKFNYPVNYNPAEQYRHCFGIIQPIDQMPEEVILSFDPIKGKYIKSLPLHDSQKIICDNDKELRIRLFIYITYDFVMELLSHGEEVIVIQPKSLIETIKEKLSKALRQY